MSETVIIDWRFVDCDALKYLGARHDWCIPYDAISKLPIDVRSEVIKAMSRLNVVDTCWEYRCEGGKVIGVKCGKYLCARGDREMIPLVIKTLRMLGLL